MKHYLVTGRMCGDDEDSHLALQIESRAAAVEAFVDWLWAEVGMLASYHRDQLEANGEGVFVNAVFESETEIKEAT